MDDRSAKLAELEGPAREIYRGVVPLEGVLEPRGVIFGLEFEEPLLCDFALALRCAVERPDEAPVLPSDGVLIEVPSVALDPALPRLVEPVDVPLSGMEPGTVEPGVPLGLLVEPEPDPVVLPVLVDWADATVASPRTAMASIVV